MSNLDKIMAQINKQFGEDTIKFLAEDDSLQIKTYSSGSLMLDLALGIGGLPVGRLIEVYGQLGRL